MLQQLKKNPLGLQSVKHFPIKSKENSFTKVFSFICLKEKYVYKITKDFLVRLIHTTVQYSFLKYDNKKMKPFKFYFLGSKAASSTKPKKKEIKRLNKRKHKMIPFVFLTLKVHNKNSLVLLKIMKNTFKPYVHCNLLQFFAGFS